MKRMFTALTALFILLSALVSCDTYMVEYMDDAIGLYYELPRSLEYYKYGERGTYKNYRNESGTVAVVIYHYTNEELLSGEAFDKVPTLEEYINHTVEEQQLGEIEIDYNEDKSRATFDLTVRESANDAGQYIYHTLIKNDGAIYIIQMICNGNAYADYVGQFIRWSNQIYTY